MKNIEKNETMLNVLEREYILNVDEAIFVIYRDYKLFIKDYEENNLKDSVRNLLAMDILNATKYKNGMFIRSVINSYNFYANEYLNTNNKIDDLGQKWYGCLLNDLYVANSHKRSDKGLDSGFELEF